MESLHLHQIPINLDEWGKLTVFLSCAEEGALMRAVRVSWAASIRGEAPGTLPDDDVRLARALGGEAEHVSLVRRYFAPDGEGGLVWEWLAQLYRTALAKYEARVAANKARWEKEPPGTSRRAVARRNAKAGKPLPDGRSNASALQEQPNSSLTEKKHARDGRARAAPSAALAAPSAEPTPLEIDAWAEAHPGDAAEIGQEVDAWMSEINPRWRETARGGAIRTQHLRAAITAAMQGAREGPRLAVPLTPALVTQGVSP